MDSAEEHRNQTTKQLSFAQFRWENVLTFLHQHFYTFQVPVLVSSYKLLRKHRRPVGPILVSLVVCATKYGWLRPETLRIPTQAVIVVSPLVQALVLASRVFLGKQIKESELIDFAAKGT
jgi:hypothetical protein